MRPQAIALNMAPKNSDPLLRFFDTCPAYAAHEKVTNKWLVRVCVVTITPPCRHHSLLLPAYSRARTLTHHSLPLPTCSPAPYRPPSIPRPPGWRQTGLA